MPTVRAPALWVVVAGLHALAAVYAWRMLPHGFAIGHPRFWINEVLPVVIATAAATCVFTLRRPRVASASIGLLVGLYLGMAPAWLVAFPVTGGRVAIALAVIALMLCGIAFVSLTRRAAVLGAAAGAVIGITIPWSQRGADPATHPAMPVHELAKGDRASVALDLGAVHVELHPVLTFISRSPDRGWTVFANAQQRIGAPQPFAMRVSDDQIDVETLLPTEVYSHLNYFTAMTISGHRHLFLAFSPMPEQRIEVTYSEYPTGRPSRFAYLDAASVLHVVEAESGEKGPFRELAHGLLAGAPLGITLYDEDTAIAQLDFADFAAQASTQTSPTAGWGVPENAIELSLSADRPDATASIFMTLAGTSVGRGWDSVGHAPGVYRNRIAIRRLTATSESRDAHP